MACAWQNCWFGPPKDPPWCGLYTFHAHCTGSLREKLDRMRLVLRETRSCTKGRVSGDELRRRRLTRTPQPMA
jgi:hypothetical protein